MDSFYKCKPRSKGSVVTGSYVYILSNDNLSVLYTGCTTDLKKRINHHKQRYIGGFTKKYNVHRLVYFELLGDIDAAKCREQAIKGITRARKEALINSINPSWRDLYEDILLNPLAGKDPGLFVGDPSLRSG